MSDTIRIVCDTSRCADCAHECKGRGWMDAHLRGEVKHPTSPCCQAPWKVAPSGAWTCSACGGEHDRRSVAGW